MIPECGLVRQNAKHSEDLDTLRQTDSVGLLIQSSHLERSVKTTSSSRGIALPVLS